MVNIHAAYTSANSRTIIPPSLYKPRQILIYFADSKNGPHHVLKSSMAGMKERKIEESARVWEQLCPPETREETRHFRLRVQRADHCVPDLGMQISKLERTQLVGSLCL